MIQREEALKNVVPIREKPVAQSPAAIWGVELFPLLRLGQRPRTLAWVLFGSTTRTSSVTFRSATAPLISFARSRA